MARLGEKVVITEHRPLAGDWVNIVPLVKDAFITETPEDTKIFAVRAVARHFIIQDFEVEDQYDVYVVPFGKIGHGEILARAKPKTQKP